MKKYMTTPAQDGYRMPGEFERHEGCLMIWPMRPGSWIHGGDGAKQAFAQVAEAIADSERVTMLTDKAGMASAKVMLSDRIEILEIESDDAWARDVGPTFVVNGQGDVRGVDWQFNAWGGTFDGLYADWRKDDLVASRFCEAKGYPVYPAKHFVLEGGSVHSDGEGTVIVTEACLLSPGRNPQISKAEIEGQLKTYLGAEKIIWLSMGIFQDETNQHVDNVCAFVRPGEVVLAWTDDQSDPQYEMSLDCFRILEQERDAKGRNIKVNKLPIPKQAVCITEEERAGFVFEDGEEERTAGERLAASYVNFYISNEGIIVPQFGDENDEIAVGILSKLFPERKIYPVYARDIIVGGGNIHCITQQIPAGRREGDSL